MMTQDQDGHFGMRTNRAQLDSFTALAKANHRTAAQLVREFIEGYVATESRRHNAAAKVKENEKP